MSRAARVGSLLLTATALGGLVAAAAAPVAVVAGAASNATTDYWANLPTELPIEPVPQRSTILAADGTKIAEFFSENRVNITLDQVSPIARRAIVAIEDDRFYEHGGVDLRGLARAVVNNANSGGRQGGSTLTQQYVKNVLLNNADTPTQKAKAIEISLERKAAEARLASELERTMTKDEILEGYLNIAYFGDGAYGIGTAAQHYFSVPAKNLTLEQAALLAGLVQNPDGYDPTRHPKAATTRRAQVLGRMRDTGVITAAQAAAAVKTPLGLKVSDPANGCTTSRYPFYCQWIRNTLATDPIFGANQDLRNAFLYRGGLTIKTNLDPRIQDIAQKSVDDALGRDNQFAAGLAIVQPGTGKVVAFAQNRDFGLKPGQTQQIYPVSRAFQNGSTFKPITYAAGLENGFPVNGVLDAPARFRPETLDYPPGGFRNQSTADVGRLTASQAVARSSNTWFVKLEEQVGVPKVVAMANRIGLHLPTTIGPREGATTLGVHSTSPVELASVYATFAAHGRTCKPTGIVSMTDAKGQPVKVPDAGCHQELQPGIADAVSAAMVETVDGSDEFRTGKKLSIGRPVAGKTGTTDSNAAVWFGGFTPQYSAAVWVGDPRGGQKYPVLSIRLFGQRINAVFGATAAGPIWQNAMKGIMAPLPVQQFPRVSPAVLGGAVAVMPDVRGLAVLDAVKAMNDAGIAVTISARTAAANGVAPANTVASQSVAGGTTVGVSGKVELVLTAGSNTSVALPPQP